MELWIRSQNKGALVKVEILGYTNGTICSYSGNNKITLGEYSSAERALEVLDEIQKILQPQMVLSKVGEPIAETCDGTIYVSPNEYEIKELSCILYEMPKE